MASNIKCLFLACIISQAVVVCSEPLFTSQPSFKNQAFTQPHDKNGKKIAYKPCGALKAPVWIGQGHSLCSSIYHSTSEDHSWPQWCRHLYILQRGTKGHREHLEWQILLQRKEKIRKLKQCAIYVIVSKTVSCSAPFANTLPSFDIWELLWFLLVKSFHLVFPMKMLATFLVFP